MEYSDLLNSFKICDSHLHLSDCKENSLLSADCNTDSSKTGNSKIINSQNYYALSSAHSKKEFENQAAEVQKNSDRIFSSFGIHPQNPDLKNLDFLESLLSSKKIDAVGEAGFDFFTEEFKSREAEQKTAFEAQLELCKKYCKPVVLHGRKCNDRFFYYSKELSKLPGVIFHSYMGTFDEAVSLLSKGINGYFSFGKQILNGNKKAIDCVSKLEADRLLLETDAPYQTLKGEVYTLPQDILRVYKKAFYLRRIDDELMVSDYSSEERNYEKINDFCDQLYSNLLGFLGKL